MGNQKGMFSMGNREGSIKPGQSKMTLKSRCFPSSPLPPLCLPLQECPESSPRYECWEEGRPLALTWLSPPMYSGEAMLRKGQRITPTTRLSGQRRAGAGSPGPA